MAKIQYMNQELQKFVSFVADRVIMTQLDILRLFRETEPEPVKENFSKVLIDTIRRHPGLNAPSIAEHTGHSLRTTQRYLGELKKEGLIRFEGVAKKGGYHIN